MPDGIKSKERVKQHGEVFTPHEIVVDMVNLGDNTENLPIEKTYFEPACGDGQFLIELLYRKLLTVQSMPVEQRELALVKAVCSLYGVDIQLDNVRETRQRLLDMLHGESIESFTLTDENYVYKPIELGINFTDELNKTLEFILRRNIQCGNTLTNRKYITEIKRGKRIKELSKALTTEDDKDSKDNIELYNLNEYDINLFGTNYKFSGENITMIEEQLNDSIQVNVTGREYAETHYLELSNAKIIKNEEDEQLDLL